MSRLTRTSKGGSATCLDAHDVRDACARRVGILSAVDWMKSCDRVSNPKVHDFPIQEDVQHQTGLRVNMCIASWKFFATFSHVNLIGDRCDMMNHCQRCGCALFLFLNVGCT